MVSGQVSVPSHTGPVIFTVTGTNTLLYAQRFASAINSALKPQDGTLAYKNLSNSSDSIPGYTSSTNPLVIENEISAAGSYTLPAETVSGGVYTFVDTAGVVTVTGSGVGDDLLVGNATNVPADSVTTIYDDVGGNNVITFTEGNNTYNGDSVSSAYFDVVVAGSGKDSLYGGAGRGVFYSGTGSALIDLQDTKPSSASPTSINPDDYNQFALLDNGSNTVLMNGVADVAIATAPGQTIVGGSGHDLITLVPPSGTDSITAGNDAVNAGSGLTEVYDGSNNNLIWGEAGTLVVTFANDVEGSVVAGTGSNLVYGSTGDTINYYTTESTGSAIFVGSAGESVDAHGNGSLTLVLGTGNETLIGGSGPTNFNANYDSTLGAAGTITIEDFGGKDVFDFVGYTAAEYEAALATGTVTSSGYQITLSDKTTVTFVGVNGLTGHTSNT